jgi:hypothetical protein
MFIATQAMPIDCLQPALGRGQRDSNVWWRGLMVFILQFADGRDKESDLP